MSINLIIEENLKNRISTKIKVLNGFSFEQNIKKEIDEIGDVNWINETDQSIEQITDSYKITLGKLLNETELH